MEEENKVEKVLGHLKEYAETRYELGLLNAQEKFSNVLSSVASIAVLGILIIFIFLFGSIGIALWLGEYYHNSFIGFFYIAGFYILLSLLLFFNREKWIKSPLINTLIKKINHNDEN